MAETLATYRSRFRGLLGDAAASFFDDPTVDRFINDALDERDMWSGGSRSYQPDKALTPAQELYDLPTLFPSAGLIFDVISVTLIYGTTRVLLDNPPFTDLTLQRRAIKGWQNRPAGWARYGHKQVFIAPAPSTAYLSDWDLVVDSGFLTVPADPDPLQFPYTVPVPFYAAYLAKITQRQWQEADTYLGFFQRAIRDIEGSRVGEMQTAYSGRAYGAR